MKKTFLWYYTVIWLILGTLYNFLDWINYLDDGSFFALAIAVPTIIWLFRNAEK